MLDLQSFLIPSICKDLLWKELETITADKDDKHMGVQRFARAPDDMQSKLIYRQGCKLITDEVKIWKFHNNIPDNIKTSITPHLTDDMTYSYIITKSEHFDDVDRGAIAEYTKPGYASKVSRDTNATCSRLSYST